MKRIYKNKKELEDNLNSVDYQDKLHILLNHLVFGNTLKLRGFTSALGYFPSTYSFTDNVKFLVNYNDGCVAIYVNPEHGPYLVLAKDGPYYTKEATPTINILTEEQRKHKGFRIAYGDIDYADLLERILDLYGYDKSPEEIKILTL